MVKPKVVANLAQIQDATASLKVMDAKLIALQGVLTAQSHLIELLLAALVVDGQEPVDNLERLRKLLGHNFRFDMKAVSNQSLEELSAIQTAAVNHLRKILDGVRDRVSSQPGVPEGRINIH